LFAGNGDTLGKCGDLVFRNEEFAIFWTTLRETPGIEFIPEVQEMTAEKFAEESKKANPPF